MINNNDHKETMDTSFHCNIKSPEFIDESQTNGLNQRRKRANTSSLTRKKKLRSDSNIVDENANDIHSREEINHDNNNTIDYLSLQPERIVSITRSRTSAEQLEFLLKCTQCPTKLFFISNEKAKELVPDLLIDFYERHINWFIDRPSSRSKSQKRKS